MQLEWDCPITYSGSKILPSFAIYTYNFLPLLGNILFQSSTLIFSVRMTIKIYFEPLIKIVFFCNVMCGVP